MTSKSAYNAFVNIAPTAGVKLSGMQHSGTLYGGKLHKHCQSIHLPAADRKILLGTLSEFRKHENEHVRDELEAKFKLELDFPNTTVVTKRKLVDATLGTLFVWGDQSRNNTVVTTIDGQFSTFCVHSRTDLVIEQDIGDKFLIHGKIAVYQDSTDALVFCLTKSNSGCSVIEDTTYESSWSIKKGCVPEFAKRISEEVLQILDSDGSYHKNEFIGKSDCPGFCLPDFAGKNIRMGVMRTIETIQYPNKEIIFSSDITEDNLSLIHTCFDRSVFIKPLRFELEQEVRIIFRPMMVDEEGDRVFFFPNLLRQMLVPFKKVLDLVQVDYSPAVIEPDKDAPLVSLA